MLKKALGLAIAAVMLLVIFGLTACNNDTLMQGLKQGVYTTDDEVHSIRLYGENQFSFHISYISHLPIGTYRVEDDRLVLKYSESDELIFEIKKDELAFIGTNTDGSFVEEGPVKTGTIFKKSFVEVNTTQSDGVK